MCVCVRVCVCACAGYQVLERTTSMVEAQQIKNGRIGNISPSLMQTKRPEKLHTAVLKHLLKPFSWRPTQKMGPPSARQDYAAFDLRFEHIKKLCQTVKERLRVEPPVLQVPGPVKIFGDIHGQYGDLMQYAQSCSAAHTDPNRRVPYDK